jgi:hypothetical protein
MIFFPPLLSELYMCLGKTLVLIDLRFHLALGIQTYILDFTYILIVEVTLTNIFFLPVEEGKGSQSLGSSDRTRTYWTPPMDRYLIDLLLDQVHRGNKFGQTFISQAWIDMAALFNVKFQSHHDKDVLKNRYKHLRRLYNEIKNLLENSGFSWDETREMITAKDHIWDAYIKVNCFPSYMIGHFCILLLTCDACRHTLMLDHTELKLCLVIRNCVL